AVHHYCVPAARFGDETHSAGAGPLHHALHCRSCSLRIPGPIVGPGSQHRCGTAAKPGDCGPDWSRTSDSRVARAERHFRGGLLMKIRRLEWPNGPVSTPRTSIGNGGLPVASCNAQIHRLLLACLLHLLLWWIPPEPRVRAFFSPSRPSSDRY